MMAESFEAKLPIKHQSACKAKARFILILLTPVLICEVILRELRDRIMPFATGGCSETTIREWN